MTGKKALTEVNRMDGSSESIPLGPERWYLNITAEMSYPFGSFFPMVKLGLTFLCAFLGKLYDDIFC